MFRRRAPGSGGLDRESLEANCRAVIADLSEDFDWHLTDSDGLVSVVVARAAVILASDPEAATDLAVLRRTLEREACAEYFAGLYDDLCMGGVARDAALSELFRPEQQEDGSDQRIIYRGYLYRAAVYFLARWSGRKGWNPPPDLVEEISRIAAEDVVVALLRGVELREGRRTFWAFLSRSVERRMIDQLRAINRRQSTVSLDTMVELAGWEPAAGADTATSDDPFTGAAFTEVSRLMDTARLSPEERFSLVAGAYGLNDSEAAAELEKRTGRLATPPDIRRWRFRGRDKLRRSAEREP